MTTTPYTLRLDNELREALEHEAQLEERPAAQLAARAIRSFVDSKAAKRAAIDAALAEAERGEFITQEAMNRWIDSWGTEEELPMPDVES
ncbi:MAG: CopG family ribbon-helix-helix protein [Rhodospirillaceae bacterium]